jgi:hypothetical protein
MFTIAFKAGFGEICRLHSKCLFIHHYFAVHVSRPHWVIGLDGKMLITRKERLQLLEEILILIVDSIFQDDVNRHSGLSELKKCVFESLMSDFVIFEKEELLGGSEEGFVSLENGRMRSGKKLSRKRLERRKKS